MRDLITAVTEHVGAFRWVFFVAMIWFFYRVVERSEDMEWKEFISTKGSDGKNHPDWDKVGKGVAVIIGSWAIVAIAPNVKTDFVGFSVLLGSYFAFAACTSGYAAYLRSKSATMQTTTTVEPVPDPQKTTTVVTEPVENQKLGPDDPRVWSGKNTVRNAAASKGKK